MARCKICSKKMSRNMARHLRLKHPRVYREVQHLLEKSVNQRICKNSTSWVKGSWVKRYCEKIDENKYRCNLCHQVLSLAHGFFGNMKRHIKFKHPYVYEKEVVGNSTDDVEECEVDETGSTVEAVEYFAGYFDEAPETEEEVEDEEKDADSGSEQHYIQKPVYLLEDDPEFESKVKYLLSRQFESKKRTKCTYWNFYNVVEENRKYSCLACNKIIAIFPNNVANLKRHIRIKHKRQYEIIEENMREISTSGKVSPVSFDKFYFDSEGDNCYKCKECGENITCADEEQQILFDHIKDKHPDQILTYQEENLDEDYNVVIVKNE